MKSQSRENSGAGELGVGEASVQWAVAARRQPTVAPVVAMGLGLSRSFGAGAENDRESCRVDDVSLGPWRLLVRGRQQTAKQ